MNLDKQALKTLLSYDVLNPSDTPKIAFEYAKNQGLMFDMVSQDHDEIVMALQAQMKNISKKRITNLFLASLSTGYKHWRIGLPTYALLQSFLAHRFEAEDVIHLPNQCKYCESSQTEWVDRSFAQQISYSVGGVVDYSIYYLHFYLQQHLLLPNVEPSTKDFDIFISILNWIKHAAPKETPTVLQKKIKQITGFKSREEERKGLIETLGYCSILETATHKGFLNQFTLLGLAPQKTHSSDWRYPVDWWSGKDGLNSAALQFWFGDYPLLSSFFVV
jgi:hypothetical protein